MRQWTEDEILQQDLERIAADDSIDWEKLRGARILVTGDTGLIGGLVAKALIAAGEARDLKLHVLAVVRSKEKAKQQLSAFLEYGLELIVGDVLSPLPVEEPVDYIFHGATLTASKDLV